MLGKYGFVFQLAVTITCMKLDRIYCSVMEPHDLLGIAFKQLQTRRISLSLTGTVKLTEIRRTENCIRSQCPVLQCQRDTEYRASMSEEKARLLITKRIPSLRWR